MIIVNNTLKTPVTCAAKQFTPGENEFRDTDLSPAKLAQIANHPALKWVKVQDRPVDSAPTKATKKEAN
jgi:hypothetical protein